MNNNNLNSILSDLAENAKPAAKIDLFPGLKKSLAAGEGQSRKGKSIMNRTTIFHRATFGALTVLVAFTIFFISPQGKTFAQALLKYLTTVSQRSLPPVPTTVPVPTFTLKTGLIPQPTISSDHQNCVGTISPISSTFICQLQEAQAKLGFVVKSFPARYVQAPFLFMWVDQEHRLVQMSFRDQQASYTLDQGQGDFPKDCAGCAIYQAAVKLVRVGEYQAEYAVGAFIFPDGRVDKDMVWKPDEPVYHLRWKENDFWYSFTLRTDHLSGLAPAEIQAKMIQIAENLASLDQGVGALTAGSQASIRDNAGFTIKEPRLLPEGFIQVPDVNLSDLTISPRVGMEYDYTINGMWVNSLTLAPSGAVRKIDSMACMFPSPPAVSRSPCPGVCREPLRSRSWPPHS